MSVRDAKKLIAYFSRRGNNYVAGKIVFLEVGNTEVIAGLIQEMTGGDLFHIQAVGAYPEDYTEATAVAKRELRDQARPQLTSWVEDMAGYEVIFLGFPNWWGTMPMPVFTFLEGSELSGKTIIPFCTHEGSGMGVSVRDIKKACPDARVLDGLAIRGSEVKKARDGVSAWLKKRGAFIWKSSI